MRAATTSGLMDNFEWSLGCSKRFGMVYTDFEKQERIPKKSAAFYSDVIRTNAVDAYRRLLTGCAKACPGCGWRTSAGCGHRRSRR
jgi:hypothetical protein